MWSSRVKMNGMRLWLVALAVQIFLMNVICGKGPHHRRSLVGHANLPVSKGGWRPVVGSGGLLYGSLGTAPLHAPSYKIPVIDLYPSSSRPLASRDVAKLTSIAQSYRPTTLRTVPVSSHPLPSNQPINSYLNPFALPNGLNQYKFVQNFPVDNVLLRNQNQHSPYAARPVLQKQQTKQKQQYHNNILQQLTNVQPIQFGQYSTIKPLDLFGKPIEAYSRPDGKRPHSAETEIFKPEVFKLPNTDTTSQYLNQQVKTAQQQTYTLPKLPINQYGHPFQDTVYPSILGTFGSFGLQSVKGRDPVYPTTKTTFLPPQSTKQTIFNSFNYTPLKTTPTIFTSTTPKLSTTQNFNFLYSSTLNDLANVPTPQTKVVSHLKIDPNAETKHGFKPSPQDPFIKNFANLDFNKITTYNPAIVQTSTAASAYNGYDFLSQNIPFHSYKNQETINNYYDKTKQKVSDSVGLTQQVSQQYTNAPGLFDLESSLNALSHHPSYAVVENVSEDVITNSSPAWTVTPQSYKHDTIDNQEPVTNHDHVNNIFEKPTTSLPEEYAIVTEGGKSYENTYNYENQFDTQSRRPLDDDFEPIGKTKLKEYYYRVSTPSFNDHKPHRRTKKPTETPKLELTTPSNVNVEVTDVPIETFPTLPPNQHFKRPSTSDNLDRDKIRKRNKIRRRRPSLANGNKYETSTRNDVTSTENALTTITDEVHTIRPRTRPSKFRSDITITTPTETTEFTTSALPTTSPTKPTIVKKKVIGHRRPLPSTTVSDKLDTTTQSLQEKDYSSRESSIMKISTRPQIPKSPNSYEFKNGEIPDYSHKQDEKDTPTSDVSVSLTDTLKTTDSLKEFSFHRDLRPVENKESTTESVKEKNEATTIPSRTETNTRITKIQRPRLKNKLDRPKFSVKDYRNRLNSTTSTTEKISESTPKSRYSQRKSPYTESIFSDVETTTERKKFTPKEPRHKFNRTENNETEIHSRQNVRQKQNSENEVTTQKISSRIRQRRPRPNEETSESSSPTTVHSKRPLRKRIQDSETGESVQDITVTETTAHSDYKNDITSERTRSESAIMKIADKKHQDHIERLFEHSKRVSDLTLAASKDYNTPGMFKTVASNSRRIPSYFTIATDDPILPIEAFFPQLNQKKES